MGVQVTTSNSLDVYCVYCQFEICGVKHVDILGYRWLFQEELTGSNGWYGKIIFIFCLWSVCEEEWRFWLFISNQLYINFLSFYRKQCLILVTHSISETNICLKELNFFSWTAVEQTKWGYHEKALELKFEEKRDLWGDPQNTLVLPGTRKH